MTIPAAKRGEYCRLVMELTDKEILKACARAYGVVLRWNSLGTQNANCVWDPLENDGDCARLENKCGVVVNCRSGVVVYESDISFFENIKENFCPGNDAERRRASCLVVARAQLEKEKSGA